MSQNNIFFSNESGLLAIVYLEDKNDPDFFSEFLGHI